MTGYSVSLYSICNDNATSGSLPLGVISGVVEQTSGKQDLPFPGVQPVGNLEYSPLCDVFNLEGTTFLKFAPEVNHSNSIPLLNSVKLIRILKYQGEDSEIDQIGTVDAGIGFG